VYIISKIYTFASNTKLLSTTDILISTKNSIALHEFWIAGFGFWLVLFLLSNGVEGFVWVFLGWVCIAFNNGFH
jgi:hypothetical protein